MVQCCGLWNNYRLIQRMLTTLQDLGLSPKFLLSPKRDPYLARHKIPWHHCHSCRLLSKLGDPPSDPSTWSLPVCSRSWGVR